MKQIFCNLIFVMFLIATVKSQEIKITWQNPDYNKTEKIKQFEYLNKEFNVNNSIKVATIKVFGTNSNNAKLDDIFYSLYETSKGIGANSYQIDDYYLNVSKDTIIIDITIYLTKNELFEDNNKLFPKNMVYIIGNLNREKIEGKSFKINGDKTIVLPLEFVSYQNEIGKDVTLNVGGFLGATMWIKGKENRLPKYFTLSGFGLGPGNVGQIGISVNTGRFYPVELNFGQFLVHILKENKVK